jgi:hypothetical protein
MAGHSICWRNLSIVPIGGRIILSQKPSNASEELEVTPLQREGNLAFRMHLPNYYYKGGFNFPLD